MSILRGGALVALVAGLALWAYHTWLGPVHACPECSPFAQEVVRSLREDPQAWTDDPYHLRHRRWAVTFWIASGPSFMSVEELTSNPDEWSQGPGFASREQRFVWTAYREWQKNQRPLTLSRFKMREKEE